MQIVVSEYFPTRYLLKGKLVTLLWKNLGYIFFCCFGLAVVLWPH